MTIVFTGTTSVRSAYSPSAIGLIQQSCNGRSQHTDIFLNNKVLVLLGHHVADIANIGCCDGDARSHSLKDRKRHLFGVRRERKDRKEWKEALWVLAFAREDDE